MRGGAVIIMLQGHVTHSFMQSDLRGQSPYMLSQFVGGITPAVFLFLTGITLAFLMDSRWRAGEAPLSRIKTALLRAGYLALLAAGFRLQLWTFAAGQSNWTDLFKVDILNCMAFTMVVLSPLAALNTRARVRWALTAGLGVACLAPIVSAANWSWLHPFVQHYFVPDLNYFSLFPWGAFLAFGVAAGSILRLVKQDELTRIMPWGALIGLALVAGAQYCSNLPYSIYSRSDFWLNSPGLILIKTGVLLLFLSLAFLWTRFIAPAGFSALRQLGTTSLLVYWVHTELVYGRWFGQYKERLSAGQCAAVAVALILLMVALSTLRTRLKHSGALRLRLGFWPFQPAPSPAAGD